MFTLDANIFARDFDQYDPEHPVCHNLLVAIGNTAALVVMPYIVLAEVGGSIRRVFNDSIRARLYIDQLQTLSNVSLVAVDRRLAHEAAELATDYGFRGMDAIYVATARRSDSTFVTLDNDARRRATPIVATMTPAEALASLSSS